jgi:hypothetical protein
MDTEKQRPGCPELCAVGKLNEVVTGFRQFIKPIEGSLIAYFNMFPMLRE